MFLDPPFLLPACNFGAFMTSDHPGLSDNNTLKSWLTAIDMLRGDSKFFL